MRALRTSYQGPGSAQRAVTTKRVADDLNKYLNRGALTCPFCAGLLQEDDAGLVSCQDCLNEWKRFKGRLTLIGDYDEMVKD